jgi:endonuclease/exonuclease/phosphatase family metal-dependent hydrolase
MAWLIAVVMAALALVHGAADGPAPAGVDAGPAARPALRVRVLSFNIRYANPKDGDNTWEHRRAAVAKIVESAEIVGLQEALRSQLDDLRAAGDWAEVGVGRDDGKAAGEYAAILYRPGRWKVVRSGTFWLSEQPESPGSKSWGTACTRVCTWARLEGVGEVRAGRGLWVFNTHLDHVSAEARRRGVRIIAERIAGRGDAEPFVLTGDFNAPPEDAAVRFLTAEEGAKVEYVPDPPKPAPGASPGAGAKTEPAAPLTMAPRPAGLARLVDTFAALHAGEPGSGTFNNFDPADVGGKRIDYILVPQGTRVVEAWIERARTESGRAASDHFAVGAVVEY